MPAAADAAVDLDQLLAQLTLEEKVGLLAGVDLWHLPVIERIGLSPLKMTDGPNGARGAQWVGGPPSACFPCGTALAATWDTALVQRVGQALAEETKSKGAHVLLAPTVNLHRSPLGGRDFECFSEDPFLSARMAVAVITGLQSRGVAACVKHLTANDQEFDRFNISSDVDERTLRELYLVPFEAAVNEAGAWAAMSAYNKLNGTYCGEHPWLLTELLRDEWRWDGTVVSDWWGCHSGIESLAAGLDIEMPGPPLHRGAKLVADAVDETLVDRAVRRILLLAERTGALNGPSPTKERFDDDPERTELIFDTAAAAIVMLKNDDNVLPLDPAAAVAIIGPNAARLHAEGGGSAHVTPPHIVTPLEGLQAAFEDVRYEPGCPPATRMARIDPAEITVETPDGSFTAGRSLFVWLGTEAPPWARMTTTYRPAVTGEHTFRVRGRGQLTLKVDDEEVGDNRAELIAGGDHTIALEYVPPTDNDGRLMVELRVQAPDDPGQLERAVAAAQQAQAAIVVVGFNDDTETEGRDRPGFDLPPEQVELIEAVAAANPRTVVVVNAASPVAMDWADNDNVKAVLQIWCPGQEGGRALAAVLSGQINPSGRLPTTIPRRIEDTPAFLTWPGESGHAVYGEGVFIGYRAYEQRRLEPRYPFGHGLSYTKFAYENIQAPQGELPAGQPVPIGITVTNIGERAGAEVVQLYVRDVESSVRRPPKELKAFAKPFLEPGQRATIPFLLEPRAFQFWDAPTHQWKTEPGEFEILVGSSSTDIRARAFLTVT